MKPKQSAGILLYRQKKSIEFLLAHPGGPFWKNKDAGSWSIPKGEFLENEEPLAAAIREFGEETGIVLTGKFIELQPVKQASGKMVFAWALESDPVLDNFQSNTFEMEWPPGSGKKQVFPEIDRVEWFDAHTSKEKIIPAQQAFIDELVQLLQ